MNRFSCRLLAICLAASGGSAFAQDSVTMSKDTMRRDVMSKNSAEEKKSKSGEPNRKVAVEKDSMKMKAATDKN